MRKLRLREVQEPVPEVHTTQMCLRRHSGSGLPDSKARAQNHPSGPLRGVGHAALLDALRHSQQPRVVWGVVGAQARWRDMGTCSRRGEDVVRKAFQEERSSRAKPKGGSSIGVESGY